jgi:hypothetical protein
MIFDTIIARHSDGLFLSETYDENSEGIAKAKRKVKQLLKVSISYEEDVLRTVEVEGYHLQYLPFWIPNTIDIRFSMELYTWLSVTKIIIENLQILISMLFITPFLM